MSRQTWIILTTEGASQVDARSIAAACNRHGRQATILGVIRADVVVLPPKEADEPQFRVMVIAKTKPAVVGEKGEGRT